MIGVDEALERVLAGVGALSPAPLAVSQAVFRHLAADIAALGTNPPQDTSAMDGYAVRAGDVQSVPATLHVIGEAPAGGAFEGLVKAGEAVRIFTGGPIPEGTDAVIAQEDTRNLGHGRIEIRETAFPRKHVRSAGSDFFADDHLLAAGRRLNAPALALAAASGHGALELAPQPKVAILATGDELVPPGTPPGPHQIISSNSLGLAALVLAAGGTPIDLGIAPDDPEAIVHAAQSAPHADVLVTTGGASVGERDYVQSALAKEGLTVDFWKIAMKPGKPLIFGAFKGKPFFGLPGNPVSALVTALLFLRPALLKMQGRDPVLPHTDVPLTTAVRATAGRQEYLRARLAHTSDGGPRAEVLPIQDSAGLKSLAAADALIVRPPHSPAAKPGDTVRAIPLEGLW